MGRPRHNRADRSPPRRDAARIRHHPHEPALAKTAHSPRDTPVMTSADAWSRYCPTTAGQRETPLTCVSAGQGRFWSLWQVQGSNLRRHKPTDLQSAPFGHSGNLPGSVLRGATVRTIQHVPGPSIIRSCLSRPAPPRAPRWPPSSPRGSWCLRAWSTPELAIAAVPSGSDRQARIAAARACGSEEGVNRPKAPPQRLGVSRYVCRHHGQPDRRSARPRAYYLHDGNPGPSLPCAGMFRFRVRQTNYYIRPKAGLLLMWPADI